MSVVVDSFVSGGQWANVNKNMISEMDFLFGVREMQKGRENVAKI